jgi:hypothetical protein
LARQTEATFQAAQIDFAERAHQRPAAARTMVALTRQGRKMPTSAKRPVPLAAPTAAKRTPRKVADSGSKPFLRFHHSLDLRAKTIEVLEAVETAEKPTALSGRLTELVLELTDCGMDQFFLQSLKATKANFVVQQSAALGLSGVQKVMGTVIRNILGRMDDRQLISVCGSIRKFMA